MNQAEWMDRYLKKVSESSEEGAEAARFAREKNIRVGMKRARRSVGAFWTLGKSLYLNKVHYTMESALEEPRATTLFVHEVRHLQQGIFTALSIYGELDAWQYEFRLYKKLTGRTLKPELEELLALSLGHDRATLRQARSLMTKFAGFWYLAWLLPLFPIHKEIAYWVTRKIF
ncbi:MAG: hypothetical protein DYG85_09630 [Chloroflexi bacterium CFX1]|nr:hypothetical protein [Chloroflexi bacterium CFX1]MCQ3952714.1 hypothetical protein [Chloroflexota bacterium]MDL1919217.1 hypothetical protein [Chloroflexi bacterium CFX5]NUQ59269.1 hypothetical protein [Anaerolineales bacterium]